MEKQLSATGHYQESMANGLRFGLGRVMFIEACTQVFLLKATVFGLAFLLRPRLSCPHR